MVVDENRFNVNNNRDKVERNPLDNINNIKNKDFQQQQMQQMQMQQQMQIDKNINSTPNKDV